MQLSTYIISRVAKLPGQSGLHGKIFISLCVLVLCTDSGEYDVSEVTLSVHPYRAG